MKMLEIFKRYKIKIILGMFFKTIEAVGDLLLPFIMAKIVDKGMINKDFNYIVKMGTIMIGIASIGYLSAILCNFYSVKATEEIGGELRKKLFTKTQLLTSTQVNKYTESSLIIRMTKDIEQVSRITLLGIKMGLKGIMTGIGAIIMSYIINPKMSSIIFIIVPLSIFYIRYYMKKSMPNYIKVQKSLDMLTVILRENINGVRIIKSFSKNKYEEEKFNEKNENFKSHSIEAQSIVAKKIPLLVLILNSGIVLALYIGMNQVSQEKMGVGSIIAFVNYFNIIFMTLSSLSFLFSNWGRTSISVKRINEVLEEPLEEREKNKDNLKKNKKNPYIIEFKNVSFSYENNDSLVLDKVSFNIKEGEKIAILGGVGSGKTTLINLIPKFYKPTKGEVLVLGENTKEWDIKKLRDNISIIAQKNFLFSGTINENLKWGDKNISDEKLNEIIKETKLKDLLESFHEKGEAIVKKGGVNFSGGQKQRIAIARALVKESKILILDDSFSALDSITESQLKKSLFERNKNKTIILISQRILSIKNFQKIIVLDFGKIVGIGTHDELIKNCNIYKEICTSQDTEVEVKTDGE
ncbi:MAG: ABC transporter ATP-binding protein [Fusobacteriaceae bacterium]